MSLQAKHIDGPSVGEFTIQVILAAERPTSPPLQRRRQRLVRPDGLYGQDLGPATAITAGPCQEESMRQVPGNGTRIWGPLLMSSSRILPLQAKRQRNRLMNTFPNIGSQLGTGQSARSSSEWDEPHAGE